MSNDVSLGATGDDSGHGDGASTGSARQCLAGAAFPNSHGHIVWIVDPNKFHIGSFGKCRVGFYLRADPQYQSIRDGIDERDAMRVTHRDTGHSVGLIRHAQWRIGWRISWQGR